MKKRLLKIDEAAEYLSTTKGRLYQLVHKSKIPHVKIGRSLRFDIEELEKFIKENSVVAKLAA